MEEVLSLCLRWHILRSYRFVAKVTFKCSIFFHFKKYAGLQTSIFPETELQTNIFKKLNGDTLREKCSYSELFWSVFSHIRTKYREIRSYIQEYIQSESGKIRTRITPNTDTFYAVEISYLLCIYLQVFSYWKY